MCFSLTILGSSSALPTSQRSLPAHVIKMHERVFLIDCGEGTQIQLRKYRVRLARIHNIFISHLHGDHYFGLFGLINSFNLLGRKSDLHIYAPADLEKILDHQLFYFDKLNYKIIFHPLEENKAVIFEDDKLTVKHFPLKHKIPTWGFIFLEKQNPPNIKKELVRKFNIPFTEIIRIKNGGDLVREDGKTIKNIDLVIPAPKPRSMAYCSDTMFYPAIIPVIKKVDLLYHEASFSNEDEWRATNTTHSTGKQAATIAREAEVGKMVIGHFSARYKNLDFLLEECKEVFANTELAIEGRSFEI